MEGDDDDHAAEDGIYIHIMMKCLCVMKNHHFLSAYPTCGSSVIYPEAYIRSKNGSVLQCRHSFTSYSPEAYI